MFSDEPADVSSSGAVSSIKVRNVELTGPDAQASITADEGHTLLPVRIVASGTSPTRILGFSDNSNQTITSDSGMASIIQEIGTDGFEGTCDAMTALNDSDAGASDPAEVQAYEFSITSTED